MRFTLVISVLFLLISCKEKEVEKTNDNQNMIVKQSEMAALMLEMFEVGAENKQLVLKGKFPKNYPENFTKIHSAVLTDPSGRDVAFKGFADFYLLQQKELYELSQKDFLIEQHNNVVNSCISCHQVKCVGPIPRIKKLLIK